MAMELLSPHDTMDTLHNYYGPPYIALAHLFNAPKGWELQSRSLKQYQFQYVVDGFAEYTIEDRIYETNRGDLIFHCPEQLHSVKTTHDQPYVCISIVFHFGGTNYPLEHLIGGDNYLGRFVDTEIESKLSRLVAHYHQPGLMNQTLCQGLLMQVFYELAALRSKEAELTKIQKRNQARMILIRNHIAGKCREGFTLAELERISGLSRNYLIQQYKITYGMTPYDYLTAVRVERAKELAIQTNLTFGEIADLVGYTDVHTLGRTFKRKTGVSLSQFCASLVT